MSSRMRRTTNRSMSVWWSFPSGPPQRKGCWGPTQPAPNSRATSLADRHAGEELDVDRARHITLDVLLERQRRARVGVRNARKEVHDHVVRLLVQGGPLRERRLVARLREDVEDRGVVEAPLLLRRPEEGAVEVVRVTVVAGPPIQEHLRLARLDAAEVVGVPRGCVRDDLEPGLRQARRERLEVLDR